MDKEKNLKEYKEDICKSINNGDSRIEVIGILYLILGAETAKYAREFQEENSK